MQANLLCFIILSWLIQSTLSLTTQQTITPTTSPTGDSTMHYYENKASLDSRLLLIDKTRSKGIAQRSRSFFAASSELTFQEINKLQDFLLMNAHATQDEAHNNNYYYASTAANVGKSNNRLQELSIGSTSSSNGLTITVENNFDNYTANAAYCTASASSTMRSYCNLRSAWMACLNYSSSTTAGASGGECSIVLPESRQIYLNLSYSALELQSYSHVSIIGRKTIVTGVDIPVSTSTVVHNSSFPVDTGTLSNTDSAQVKYVTRCLTLCPGQQVNISTCNSESSGDTYIRLFQGTQQVAENDDGCGDEEGNNYLLSQLLYTVLPNAPSCEQFCVHFGCSGDSSCINYGIASISDLSSSQMVAYYPPVVTSVTTQTPSLHLHNMTITRFGNIANNGGAFTLNGDVDFTMSYCILYQNTALYGSALYINNNQVNTHIHHSFISASYVYNPLTRAITGLDFDGIYFNGNSSNVLLENNVVISSIVFAGLDIHRNIIIRDTSLYIRTIILGDFLCQNVTISNIDVHSVGWSFIYTAQQSLDLTIQYIHFYPLPNVSFVDTSFLGIGFPLYGTLINIGPGSDNIIIDNVVCQCNNLNVMDIDYIGGGNVILVVSSSNVHLSNVNISYCKAAQQVVGGMVSIVNIANSTLDNILLTSVESLFTGGGIFLEYNTNITIQNSLLQECVSTSYGGGLAIYNENNQIQILNTTFLNNHAAWSGGAIYLGNTNNYVTIGGSSFLSNTAGASGGALFLSQNNYQFVMIDSLGYENTMVLETTHPYIVPDTYQGATTARTIIYQQIVCIANVSNYILNFDQETKFQTQLELEIIDNNNQNVLFSVISSEDLPGVNAPSLHILTNNFTFVFYAPAAKIPITLGIYGIKAYVYPCFPMSMTTPTILDGNQSPNGKAGSMMIYYANQFSVLLNLIVKNSVGFTGGGIFYQIGNIGGVIQQSIFTQNSAFTYGGSILIQSGQFGMSIMDCVFDSNTAGSGGGAMLFGSSNGLGVLSSGNPMHFINVSFTNNMVPNGRGGAIYSSDENVFLFTNSSFMNNQATVGEGGVLFMSQSNYVNFSGVTLFANNIAGNSGGAIYMSEFTMLYMRDDVIFVNNSAGYAGGAVVLFNASAMNISAFASITFKDNRAGFGGGAMLISSSPLWIAFAETNVYCINNTAPRGSVLFIYNLLTDVVVGKISNKIMNTSFIGNTASIGGTVFWIYDSTLMNAEPNVRDDSNKWIDNVAGYGNQTATQAITLSTPSMYNVTVYGGYLTPAINITLYDYYQQLITLTGDTSISVSIIDSNCTSYAFLSGPDLSGDGVSMINNTAVFNELQASCSPQGWMKVQFNGQLGSLQTLPPYFTVSSNVIQSFYVQNTTHFKFRECIAGEYETKGQCQVCQDNLYSLEANAQSCSSCKNMAGVASCQSNELYLEEGYWRRHANTDVVQACLLDKSSCVGGDAVGDASCGVGYEGPLCAVCSSNYFLSNNQCIECTTSSQFTPPMIALFLLVVIVLVIVILIYRALKKSQSTSSSANNEVDQKEVSTQEQDTPQSTIVLVYYWMKEKYDEIIVRVKILISTFQVISSTASVFAISLPSSFSSFMNGLKFFNVNVSGIFPIGCSEGYNFVSTILWTSLGPIAVSFFLLLCFGVEYLVVTRMTPHAANRHEEETRLIVYNEKKSKYLNYFFYLTYLVLPSVTTTLFQWFICTNVDPEHQDSDHYDLYLTADMSISCQSTYYKNWTIYVALMIVLYPFGIPALYLYLLYERKEEIIHRDHEEENAGDCKTNSFSSSSSKRNSSVNNTTGMDEKATPLSIAQQVDEELAMRYNASSIDTITATEEATIKKTPMTETTQRLSFLWQAYEPKFWYWEVIETTRKLVLTAVLSVCAPGSSQQSVLGVLLSYAYIRLYSYCRPYEEDAENVLAETGQMQILFTFFVTLVIRNALLNTDWNYGLGIVLTLLNLTIIFLTLYYEVLNYRQSIQETREREAKMRAEQELKRRQKRLEFAQRAGATLPSSSGKDEDNDSGKGGSVGGPVLQFKKINANELQKKTLRSQVDSDDEEGEDNDVHTNNHTVRNVLHASAKSNSTDAGAVELKSFGRAKAHTQSPYHPSPSQHFFNNNNNINNPISKSSVKKSVAEIDSDDEDD